MKILKLPEDDFRLLRRAIKQLIRDGQVVFGPNHLVMRANASLATTAPVTATATSKSLEGQDSETAETRPAKQPKRPRGEATGIFRTAPARDFGFVRSFGCSRW